MDRDGEKFFVDINHRSQESGDALHSECSVVFDLSETECQLREALKAVRAAMGLEQGD